jgi:hypothetical protein
MLTSRPLTSLVDVSCSIGADPFLNMHETWPMQNQIQSKCDCQSKEFIYLYFFDM